MPLGRIWCPISGRFSRALTTTRGKQGCCHSPAVLIEGHLACYTAGPTGLICGFTVGPICALGRQRCAKQAPTSPHSCSFTFLALCHLFFLASLLARPRNGLHLGLVSCMGCRVAKGLTISSGERITEAVVGTVSALDHWRLCLGRQRHSSSGLGRVQGLLCEGLASSWPLEVSSGTAKSEGMCLLARPSVTTSVFTATLAGGYIGSGRWSALLVFGCEGYVQSKGVIRQ